MISLLHQENLLQFATITLASVCHQFIVQSEVKVE